jgi:hypothetical protein
MSTVTDVERPRFEAQPRPFQAAHSGTCSTCRIQFDAGELIERSDSGWSHETCPEDGRRFGEQCTGCFTAKSMSGECLC